MKRLYYPNRRFQSGLLRLETRNVEYYLDVLLALEMRYDNEDYNVLVSGHYVRINKLRKEEN